MGIFKQPFLFERVKCVLDEEDIEGLLSLACPPDEYDCEASLIAGRILKVSNMGDDLLDATQIQAIVSEVWNEQFGPFSDHDLKKRTPAFASVARQILGYP